MKFTETQITKMKENMKAINNYIETNILPHISYDYETPTFGPCETWGRFNENSGSRYSICLNKYSEKISFCHCGIPRSIEENILPQHMMNFLEYWQDAKMAFNAEIELQKKNDELINNFKI